MLFCRSWVRSLLLLVVLVVLVVLVAVAVVVVLRYYVKVCVKVLSLFLTGPSVNQVPAWELARLQGQEWDGEHLIPCFKTTTATFPTNPLHVLSL